MTVAAVALVALVALLFYRWVSPQHKRIAGKAMLAVLALAILGVFAFVADSRRSSAQYERERASIRIRLVPLDGSNPFDYDRDSVAFEICNRGNKDLEYVNFLPKAYVLGRSTGYDVRLQTPGAYVSTLFESDYIIPPRECVNMTWTGRFYVADSVSAEAGSFRFAK